MDARKGNIYEILNGNKQFLIPVGVLIDLRRSSMVFDIAALINGGAITIADLDGFSDELKNKVKNLTRRV